MQNINFDEGYKELSINNDETRVIRFNPSDYGLFERLDTAKETMANALSELDDIEIDNTGEVVDEMKEFAHVVRSARKAVCDAVDYIFNSEVSKVAFGNQSPISTVKGKYLFELFLEAVIPYIEKEMKAEQKESEKRIKKYTSKVK